MCTYPIKIPWVLTNLFEVLQGVLDRDSPITSQVEGRIILVLLFFTISFSISYQLELWLIFLSWQSPNNIWLKHCLNQVKDGMDLNEVGVRLASKGASLARGAAAGLPEAILLLASLLFASLWIAQRNFTPGIFARSFSLKIAGGVSASLPEELLLLLFKIKKCENKEKFDSQLKICHFLSVFMIIPKWNMVHFFHRLESILETFRQTSEWPLPKDW